MRNWPIRAKIAALLVVPLLAVGGLLGIIVHGSLGDAQTGRDVRDFSRFTVLAGDSIDALQRERALTAAAVSAQSRGDTGPLTDARQRVDRAMAAFNAAASKLSPAKRDSSVRDHLDGITTALSTLRDVRTSVDSGDLAAGRFEQYYTAAIGALLALNGDLDSYASGPDVGARADAVISLSTAKEAFAQEGSFINGRLAAGRYEPGDYRRIIQLVGASETRQAVFRESASLGEDRTFATTVSGPKASRAVTLQEQLLGVGDSTGRLPVASGTWWVSVSDRLAQIRATERSITEGLVTASVAQAKSASGTVLSTILAALGVLVVSIALSLLIARSLVRPLRMMRSAALDTADRGLAEMVDKLQAGEPVEPEVAPIPVLSQDEVGQVAAAFNSVHGVAVRMAMEQAATRKSTSDTFLNIARRSQALIHRQLQLIDDMERGTTEPLELEELFRLDHLATRMRRHAEDLIVLSGSTPARGWSRPVGLRDVVRGAMAEVEDYTRIAMRSLDDAEVIGPAVGDVIHLFAELLENATSFSPPTTWVYVHGQIVANGYVVEIDDAGLGMDEQRRAELNSRLSGPLPGDVQGTERLGLFVVGRLAQRHGIDVHLRRSPYGGTTAIVLLPNSLLQGRAPALTRSGPPSGPPPGPDPTWRNGSAPAARPAGLPGGPPQGLPAAPTPDRAPAPTGSTAVAALDRAPTEPRQLGTSPNRPDWFADDLPVPRGPVSATPPEPGNPAAEAPPPPTPTTPTVRVATLLSRSNRTDDPPGTPDGGRSGSAETADPANRFGATSGGRAEGLNGPGPDGLAGPGGGPAGPPLHPPGQNSFRGGSGPYEQSGRTSTFDRSAPPDRPGAPGSRPPDRTGPLDRPGMVERPGPAGPGPLDRPGMIGPVTGSPTGAPAGPRTGPPTGAMPPVSGGPMAAAPIEAVTENGLPRRSRQAPFGGGQPAGGNAARHRPPDVLSQRTPEETRALMASYQKGSDRGRQVTGEGQQPTGDGEGEGR